MKRLKPKADHEMSTADSTKQQLTLKQMLARGK